MSTTSIGADQGVPDTGQASDEPHPPKAAAQGGAAPGKAHEESVAGEEDPGASLDAPPPPGPAPTPDGKPAKTGPAAPPRST